LVDAVAALTHVDRLQALVELRQKAAPGMLVINAVAKSEGISGTYDPEPGCLDSCVLSTKTLGVDRDTDPWPEEIWQPDTWSAGPAKFRVITSVVAFAELAAVSENAVVHTQNRRGQAFKEEKGHNQRCCEREYKPNQAPYLHFFPRLCEPAD